MTTPSEHPYDETRDAAPVEPPGAEPPRAESPRTDALGLAGGSADLASPRLQLNVLGGVALLAGLLLVGAVVVRQLAVVYGQPLSFVLGANLLPLFELARPIAIVGIVVGVVALALGLVGLLLPARRRGAAAAGFALGAFGLVLLILDVAMQVVAFGSWRY